MKRRTPTLKQREKSGGTLSERHAVKKKSRTEHGLALSVLLHGALAAGLVGMSFYGGETPKPRRIYTLNFGGEVQLAAAEVAKETAEPLLPLAAELEEFDLAGGGWNVVGVPVRPERLRTERLEVAPAESFADHLLNPDFLGPEGARSPLRPDAVEFDQAPSVAAVPEDAPIELDPHTPNRIDGDDARYPRISEALGEQGDVELRLTLDEEGRVRGVVLLKGSGFERLDEAAMSAAPKWRFDLTPPAGFVAEDVLRTFIHVVHFKTKR